MTEPSRLAALPGYDTAPDVYETTQLTDDTVSTVPTSPRSPSEPSDTSVDEDDEDEESYGVSRRRLHPERARSRFGATSGRVEARGVDLSDRVDGRRRGYRMRKRRGLGGDDGEEEEGLEARIARLRREVEECRAEAGEERGGQTEGGAEEDVGGAEGRAGEVDGLSRLLAGIEVPSTNRRAQARQQPPIANGAPASGPPPAAAEGDVSDEQTLSRVADFDSRLSALEQALGISTLDAATSDAVSMPVLPSLALLDQQLSALTSATSLTNLEAAGSRIQKLRHEAQQLSQQQQQQRQGENQAPTSTVNGDTSTADDETSGSFSAADIEKLQDLYTLLPTLHSLSPTAPALLARLKSLRTLHTSAASAASELENVESRQAEMDRELTVWREGLGRVEAGVQEASEANGRNGRFVEGWVKELEGRMNGLR